MAKKPTPPKSNISTGEERIDPNADSTAPGGQESSEDESILEDGEEGITQGEVVSQEQWDAMTEEQKEEMAAASPVAKNKAASKVAVIKGLKLQPFELTVLQALDAHVGEGESYEKEIPWTVVPKEHRQQLRNFASRSLVYIDYDDDDRPISVKFTPKGVASVTEPVLKNTKTGTVTKSKGDKPATPSNGRSGPRGLYANPDLRIMRMVKVNPRRETTHGHEAWKLVRDGMTYEQYLNAPYDKDAPTSAQAPFTGPQNNHFTYDLMKGFIALYRQSAVDAGEKPYLEDGTPNVKYWAVRNEISPTRILDNPQSAKATQEKTSEANVQMDEIRSEAEQQAAAEVNSIAAD